MPLNSFNFELYLLIFISTEFSSNTIQTVTQVAKYLLRSLQSFINEMFESHQSVIINLVVILNFRFTLIQIAYNLWKAGQVMSKCLCCHQTCNDGKVCNG